MLLLYGVSVRICVRIEHVLRTHSPQVSSSPDHFGYSSEAFDNRGREQFKPGSSGYTNGSNSNGYANKHSSSSSSLADAEKRRRVHQQQQQQRRKQHDEGCVLS
jgi:hypothetical protein